MFLAKSEAIIPIRICQCFRFSCTVRKNTYTGSHKCIYPHCSPTNPSTSGTKQNTNVEGPGSVAIYVYELFCSKRDSVIKAILISDLRLDSSVLYLDTSVPELGTIGTSDNKIRKTVMNSRGLQNYMYLALLCSC